MQAYGQSISNSGLDPRSETFVEKFSGVLLNCGRLDELALRRAHRAQAQSRERFDLVLTRLGLLTEAELVNALSEFLDLPVAGARDFSEAQIVAADLPLPFLKSSRIVPIADNGEAVVVATADPFNGDALAALAYLLNRPVTRKLAAGGDVDAAIERLYGARGARISRPDIAPASTTEDSSAADVRRLEEMASDAPVIKLVQELIVRAVEMQASDVHVEPREDSVRVRYRIDGVLHTVDTLPASVRLAMSSRIKVMAGLNIAERRLPQDGRIKVNVRGREIDLRVSTMPTLCGESVVLRILDRASVELDFSALGFYGDALSSFQKLLAEPHGIILVTGPTGSGKTTTLYTALRGLNDAERKLFTVEDPIEYQLSGVNQIQVNPRIGLTFASALRSMLRQDPDIIMVGEIRDLETAEIAIRASLTGHLVLSTVHTNGAVATITRLLDMGVEDYLLASSLKGVLAQRLVRRLCPDCAEPAELPAALVEKLCSLRREGSSHRGGVFKRSKGCVGCRNTGYAGRTTIYELVKVTDSVRSAIVSDGGERAIAQAAHAEGMITMLQNGLAKVLDGETTLEEVLRVTGPDDATI